MTDERREYTTEDHFVARPHTEDRQRPVAVVGHLQFLLVGRYDPIDGLAVGSVEVTRGRLPRGAAP